MHIIVYVSDYTGCKNEIRDVLQEITKKAKYNNAKNGITGVLFFHNGQFLQVIEGPKSSLDDLMDILSKDKRHKNIVKINDESIIARSFDKWNMDSFHLPSNDKIDLEELKAIRNIYKNNFEVDSGKLMLFYKAMLQTHELADLV